MADKGQQTEQPTQRRVQKARKDGHYPAAREFVSALQFLVFTIAVASWGGEWVEGFQNQMRVVLGRAFTAADGREVALLGREAVMRAFLLLAPPGALLVLITVAVQLGVTGMGLSLNKLAPDFKRLNPVSRLRELPRQNVPALVQATLLLPVVGAVLWMLASDNLERYMALPLEAVASGARQVGESLEQLLWKAAGVFLVFGAVDLFRQLRRYRGDLRMSKQEVREEAKETDGNPQIKGKIRRMQRDVMRRRMMQNVAGASAVIVNPTHYAVAIRYAMDSMTAPVVVAKGKNWLALRIRQRAVENQVPVVENPPLAQALYKSVEVGQEIPAHLYRAVAEILAYIYRLMKGRPS